MDLLDLAGGPQSNQRGIETPPSPAFRPATWRPQSNQRGIETSPAWGVFITLTVGLNRTSVGLKRVERDELATRWGRLNRTSVGLKRWGLGYVWVEFFEPQSNQRGIETRRDMHSSISRVTASIEPAWD